MQKLLLIFYHSENRATGQIWKILPNMVFPPIWGEKWRRSEHAHASYPGSAPIWGGKKGEFRDWTTVSRDLLHFKLELTQKY